jgi:hypothetical protein
LARRALRFAVVAAVLGALFMALDALFLPDEEDDSAGE